MSVLRGVAGLMVLGCLVLAGCSSKGARAPVEDRGTMASSKALASAKSTSPVPDTPAKPSAAPVLEPSSPAAKPLPGAENAGKPGYYTVKPGDTLIRVGLDHGQSFRDIARWSGLDNPNRIEVGQVLRVEPPVGASAEPETKPVVLSSASPVALAPVQAASADKRAPANAAPVATPAAAPAAAPSTANAASADDEIAWIWPVNGELLAGFDELKNKGLDIGGKAGTPVLASADGRVVYAGAGLRGYGNLIILKHNNTYLTAYAHNQALLVKEDQTVRKGQKIAEMGSSDTDRVKLHFEVRRQGKPVDPAKYLPAR
jgi:lipoprotein NlpD